MQAEEVDERPELDTIQTTAGGADGAIHLRELLPVSVNIRVVHANWVGLVSAVIQPTMEKGDLLQSLNTWPSLMIQTNAPGAYTFSTASTKP